MEKWVESLKTMGFSNAGIMDVKDLVIVPEYRKYCEMNICGNYNLAPSCPPKCGTVAQMAAIVALFLHEVLFTAFPLDQILLWVAVALSVYSGVSYLAANRAVFTESEGR